MFGIAELAFVIKLRLSYVGKKQQYCTELINFEMNYGDNTEKWVAVWGGMYKFDDLTNEFPGEIKKFFPQGIWKCMTILRCDC